MNRRSIYLITVIFLAVLSLATGIIFVSAQAPKEADAPAQPELVVGQPGTSYRYVKTLGTLRVPYFADTTHFNRPLGLFIDNSDNFFMTEDPGNRVLKFNAAKTNLFALGIAGVCDTFCSPRDIATDKNGNFWVVDYNRAVQYSPAGAFLQEYPPIDSWMSGNTNDRFEEPTGIAFDSTGRMYISDSQNQRIQVFDLTTGSPVYSSTIGYTDVISSTPGYFDRPMRIAIDSTDRLYVTEINNNRLQRCTYTAGWTCSVVDSGYNGAQGIAIDSSNNVYITDTWNYSIHKCTPSGTCTTWATDTRGHYDLAADSAGNIYGSAPWNGVVEKYNNSGVYQGIYLGVEFVPYQTDGYHYFHPRVAIDHADNLIIVEEVGQRLIKLDTNGNLLWTVGTPGVDMGWTNDHFSNPHGVAVDKNNAIYVADGCRVQIFSPAGSYQSTLGGPDCGTGNNQFNWATGVDVDLNGNIYVVDYPSHRVMIYDSSKTYIGQIGVTGECSTANDHLCTPIAVDTDAAGNIYVTDAGNARVQKFNSSRAWQMTIGTGGGDQFDQFNFAEDIAVDAQGKIFVTDWNNERVQVYDSTGKYLTTIGGAWGTNSSQFIGVPGVDVDSKGNVYVADWDNARIQVFSPGVPGWKQANINGFGNKYLQAGALEVFNGQLYAGTTDWNNLNAIYRSSDGKTWEQVKDLGYRGSVIDMTVFNGQLYASTGWGVDNTAARVYRTSDGITWNEVVSAGFGNTDKHLPWISWRSFRTKSMSQWRTSDSSPNGVSIWRSDSGDAGSWTAVVTDGKGDTNNHEISAMIEYNGYLYAGIGNIVTGTRIWRTSDGITWNQVNTDGFGDARNIETITFALYKGNLYAGIWTNQVSNGQIWRSSNGTTWNPVITDGFGDPNKPDILGLYVFENRLYATANNNVTGTEVWATSDGDHWSQVNIDGWGDSNNGFSLRGNAGANFNNNLYISVWNSANGGEIWQMLHQVYLPFTKK